MTGTDSNYRTERYPRIVEEAARLKPDAVLDCKAICQDEQGRADFDRLHSRCFEDEATACAFDLLKLDGDDLRRQPLSERKAALRKLLKRSNVGIQYVAHCDLDGEEAFQAAGEWQLDWTACICGHSSGRACACTGILLCGLPGWVRRLSARVRFLRLPVRAKIRPVRAKI